MQAKKNEIIQKLTALKLKQKTSGEVAGEFFGMFFGNSEINNDDYELYQSNTFILGDATKEILTSIEETDIPEVVKKNENQKRTIGFAV